MFIEHQCKNTFATTLSAIEEAAPQAGWKILAQHDLQATLHNKGIEVLPATIVELCKPVYSAQVLTTDDERIYSAMMPCRLSLYEKSDGKTYCSRMNARAVEGTSPLLQQVMIAAFTEVEDLLAPLLVTE